MSGQLLKPGQRVYTEPSRTVCDVAEYLGGGGQGEVYKAYLGGKPMALKWYFPEYVTKYDTGLRERMQRLIDLGSPSDRFLWPMALATATDRPSFGYVMPLREGRVIGMNKLLRMGHDTRPKFRVLATAGFELAHSFLQIHAKGLCYRDISRGNVFFDPKTGEVRICDNDNVDVDGKDGSVAGTPDFMAPEIVRNEAKPTSRTDLHSLAVLLFEMFHNHHPLKGKRLLEINCYDFYAMREICGTKPVFIFDPRDKCNQALPISPKDEYGEAGHNALVYWPIYPDFLKELFTKAFTTGLRDAQNGRVQEGEWRFAMVRLRDSIFDCPSCGKENFYDPDKATTKAMSCWRCRKPTQPFSWIQIDKKLVMLNADTMLFPHHVDGGRMYDFSRPVASVSRHPSNPNVLGLKNLGGQKWVCTLPDGTLQDVEPDRAVRIGSKLRINFGSSVGVLQG